MTILRQTTSFEDTTVLPVIPQKAPRRQRRWSDYGLLYGAVLGLLLLEPLLRGMGLVG